MFDYREEAIKRMARRSTQRVCWTLAGRQIEFRRIPATAARNYDGSLAGDGNDPNRIILQKR